ncbi:MAG: prepilin peptidase [Planctomycetota bacterium]
MSRNRIPILTTLAILAGIATAYVFGLAEIQAPQYPRFGYERLVKLRVVAAFIFIWFLYVNGSIGSFLNVVAWRLPRGLGIGGRSQCPQCEKALPGKDNVPVLGWISLRGRCRFCSQPISPRYPLIEAIVAITLSLIAITQVYDVALPGEPIQFRWGPPWPPRLTWDVLTILVYHTVVYTYLWAFVLIRIDGITIPRKMITYALAVAVVPMLVYPPVTIVPWQLPRPEAWLPDGKHFDALMRVITALVTAALVGRALAKGLCPGADLKMDPLGSGTTKLVDLIALISLPTLLLGWQSIASVILLASILAFLLRPLLSAIPSNAPQATTTPVRRLAFEQFVFALPFATAIHLVSWRLLWNQPFWPSDQSEPYVIIAAAMLVLMIPVFLRDPPATSKTHPTEPIVENTTNSEDEEETAADDSAAPSSDELPDQERKAETDDGDHR